MSATSPNFSGSIHHVREVMDQAALDEQGLSQQWASHSLYLKKLLNLKKFALAGKKVKSWIADRGANFLTVNTGIGTNLASAELLLKSHDKFEASAEVGLKLTVTDRSCCAVSRYCWTWDSAICMCVCVLWCVWFL